ncbi:hypothetical protein DFH27DRAFT_516200 [Peziza echinospora]|nr:hypothetical protein DFH27DRAFT_516200 [Peziza echinospora]
MASSASAADGGQRSPARRKNSSHMHEFTGGRGGAEEGGSRHDFTFQSGQQMAGLRDQRRPSGASDRGGSGRGSWTRGGRGGHPYTERKPWAPIPAHSRPMMTYQREKTPEQLPGMVSGGVYADDGGEEEHEQDDGSHHGSEDEGGEHDDENGSVDMEIDDNAKEVVKAEKQKMDVITMIRKAKAKAHAHVPTPRNEVAANDDFISFGFDEEEKSSVTDDKGEDESHGRKARRGNDGQRVDDSASFSEPPPPPPSPPPPPPSTLPPPPPPPKDKPPATTGGIAFTLPAKPPPPLPTVAPTWSTMKKITKEDDHYSISSDSEEDHISIASTEKSHGKKRKHADITQTKAPSGLSPAYIIPNGSKENPYPWSVHDHSRTLHMSDLLHKEIHDFLRYIRPRSYEHAIRRHIIHSIRKVIILGLPDCDVRAFGSFASELYLPTSDLDLAVISRDFARSGNPRYASKSTLHRVSSMLKRAGIPKNGQVTVVTGAKVPILKFVEKDSGLQVDICFENFSGITANDTFQTWKNEYPAMPPLAILVKHFLEMRSLNEVYLGGLGGFSVICMIVSMLQLHPGMVTENLDISSNLGIGFMNFLELYGKKFDTERVGIDVSTHSYFRKPPPPPPTYNARGGQNQSGKQPWLLHIVDPNDEDNNISRSSYSIKKILDIFADAFDTLEKRMAEINAMTFQQRRKSGNTSILGTILGGRYAGIERQRTLMRRLFVDIFGEEPNDDEDEVVKFESDEEGARNSDDSGEKGWVLDVKGVVDEEPVVEPKRALTKREISRKNRGNGKKGPGSGSVAVVAEDGSTRKSRRRGGGLRKKDAKS